MKSNYGIHKRVLAFVMAFAMVFSCLNLSTLDSVFAASKTVKTVAIKAGSKKVTKKTVTMYSGDKKTLTVSCKPSSAKKSISFKSSKTSVASVSKKGVITAKKSGSTKIKAIITCKSGKKVSSYVNVKVKYVSLKLNKTSINLEGSNTATLKATVSPKKTVKWKTSDANVAIVTNGTVKGVNAGTATITAYVGKKTAKCKVTVTNVEATGISLSLANKQIIEGATTQASYSLTPANASGKPTFASDNASVATVNEAGVITGITNGTAKITATMPNGVSDTKTITVISKDGISLKVTNPYQATDGTVFENTQLFGKDLELVACLYKDGKPVANENITLQIESEYGNASSAYELSAKAGKTDENGEFSFVVTPSSSYQNDHETSFNYESYKIEATNSNANIPATVSVKFATVLTYKDGVTVLNNELSTLDDIDPSDNITQSAYTGIETTTALNEYVGEEYVASQQESAEDGSDDNSVYLDASPMLLIPAIMDNTSVGDWVVPSEDWGSIGGSTTSSNYSVYNDDTNEKTTATVQNVPAGLQYFTVRFNKLDLSAYTTIDISLYDSVTGVLCGNAQKSYKNNSTNPSELAVQVDKSEAYVNNSCLMVISIISQGVVDADSTGYELSSISGKWASTNSEAYTLTEMNNTVEWSVVSSVDYETYDWTYADAAKYIDSKSELLKETYLYSYKVPAFPCTGDAIITVKDANSKVLGYFLYPTVNEKNKNVLKDPSTTTGLKTAFQASEDEIKQLTNPSVTTEGNVAKVDSTKAGFVELSAKLNIAGLASNDILSASDIHTSVQFSPRPKAEESNDKPDYFAVEGQQIVVKAQLFDTNKEKKTTAGTHIKFTYGDNNTEITKDGQLIGGSSSKNQVTVAKLEDTTDAQGVATLTLTGDEIDYVENLTATSEGYNVALSFDGSDPSLSNLGGDLYWVNIGETFVGSSLSSECSTRDTQFENKTVDSTMTGSSVVGKNWKVGMLPVAKSYKFNYSNPTTVNRAKYSTKEFVSISGIPVSYSKSDSSTDMESTLTQENNVASISCAKLGTTTVTGTIGKMDEAALKAVTFTYYDENGELVTAKNVGVNTSTILESTGINYKMAWTKDGINTSIITPCGTSLATDVASVVYVYVYDNNNNPIENAEVKYSITGVNTKSETTEKTDKNGILKITLAAPGTTAVGKTSVISISVENAVVPTAPTITYKATSTPASIDKVKFLGDNKLRVYFTQNIDAATVSKEMFKFVQDDATDLAYTVTSVEKDTDAKALIITLDKNITNTSKKHTLTYASYTDSKGIEYIFMDTNGEIVTAGKNNFTPDEVK